MDKISKSEWPAWVKVGQRICEIQSPHLEGKITELTDRGFRYEFDEVKSLIPRWGMSTTGGEVYLDVCLQYGTIGFEPIYDNYDNYDI